MATKEFNIDDYSQAEIDRTKAAVENITDFVNSFSHSPELFAHLMANQHRTLQQSFSKLALVWLEFAATPEYRHDGRNEGTHQTAEWLLKAWNEWIEKNQPNTVGMPPSSWLRLI